ncbi:MAG: DUF6755 family protein [Candidatus Hydrogenedentes bacterium]|nr:DUF6755 family protein [Candidatus Hydrogenedentota bacterium]
MKGSTFARSQRGAIVLGILCIVGTLVVFQLWLLTATMEAYLGGNDDIVIPAALASVGCFLLNFGILHFYMRRLDR